MLGTWLPTLAGVALIAAALVDILQVLFRPIGQGWIAGAIGQGVWRVTRVAGRVLPAVRSFAGPAVLIGAIVVWVLLLSTGWALIYWPRLPGDFNLPLAPPPGRETSFATAFYFSLVTLTTAGYGDITPLPAALRIVAAGEALVGFALLTASISWVISVNPVIGRRRAFTTHVVHLRAAERESGISLLETGGPDVIVRGLAERLTRVHDDVRQFPNTLFFITTDLRLELAYVLPWLSRLAARGRRHPDPGVRLASVALGHALADLAASVREYGHVRGAEDDAEVLRRYASDRGATPDEDVDADGLR